MDPNNNSGQGNVVDESKKENVQPSSAGSKYKTVRPANLAFSASGDGNASLSPYGAPESAGTYEVIPHRIFVGGFGTEVDEDDLKDIFKGCGKIREVKIVRCSETGMGKGYGFVTFESDEEARATRTSSQRFEHNGKRLNLGPAMRRIYQQKPSAAKPNGPVISSTTQQPMPVYPQLYPVPVPYPMFYAPPDASGAGGQFFPSFFNPAALMSPRSAGQQQSILSPQHAAAYEDDPRKVAKSGVLKHQQQQAGYGDYSASMFNMSLASTPAARNHNAGFGSAGGPLPYKGQQRVASMGGASLAPYGQQQQQYGYQDDSSSYRRHGFFDQPNEDGQQQATPGNYWPVGGSHEYDHQSYDASHANMQQQQPYWPFQ